MRYIVKPWNLLIVGSKEERELKGNWDLELELEGGRKSSSMRGKLVSTFGVHDVCGISRQSDYNPECR